MTTAQIAKKIEQTFDINSIYARQIVTQIKSENYLKEAAKIIEKKAKPFVKWVGGKRQLLKQFRSLNLYPPEKFNPVTGTYFEPFVGGGAVFFDLLPKHAHLSDLNKELVVTYNVIKNNVEELIKSLKKHKINKDYFLKIRSNNPCEMTDVEVASRFIYLNRTCFNGMYRVNGNGKFNVPYGKHSNPLICDESNLRNVSEALQHVRITHGDYKWVLNKAKEGDFVYFDPPYHPISETSSFTSYTKESFTAQNQIELRDTFLELHEKGCFVMLSNSDAKFINDIYEELRGKGIESLRINKVDAGRSINSKSGGRGKIKEVLVTNY